MVFCVYGRVMITPKANYDLGHTQQLEELALTIRIESSHAPLGDRALFPMQGGGGVCAYACSFAIIGHL